MQGTVGSLKFALSQNNIKVVSAMAPFKPSVNKSPSYFSMSHSSELISENKKLKEENWKLKQQLTSISEELSKVKYKLKHKYEIDFYATSEKLQSQNQKKYINMLQDSIRTLKSELKSSNQENLELRQKIYSIQASKNPNIFTTPINFSSDETNLPLKENEKSDAELRKTLTYLNSEIKILQDEKVELENELGKYKEIVEGRKTEAELKPEENFQLKAEEKKKFALDKILIRSKLKDKNSDLFRFFNNFFNLASRAGVLHDSIFEYLEKNIDQVVNSEIFLQALREFQVKMSEVEVRSAFDLLKEQGKVEKKEFLLYLRRFTEKLQSDRSSDISSDTSRAISPYSSLKKFKEISINTTFDNIALQVRDFGLSKSIFLSSCNTNLPQFINFSMFLEFLHKFGSFITDPADKTLVVVNFMEGFEYKSKDEVIEKSLKFFFKYSEGFQVNYVNVKAVIERLVEKSRFFLDKFQEFDAYEAGSIGWESVYSVLSQEKALFPSEVEDFKLHCYSLSRNLKKIPFKLLFASNELTNINKLPKIRAFIKSKTLVSP